MKTPCGSPNRAAKKFGPGSWWWNDFRSALASGSEAFRRLGYWFDTKTPRPPFGQTDWTAADRQAFEFLFWLYEVDARVRGTYLFGAAIPRLGSAELTELIRPAHPLKGCLPRWVDLALHDPGKPLGLRSDRIAYPTPYLGQRASSSGHTAWTNLKDGKTGRTSFQPITINLLCSNRSIYGEFLRRREEIGFALSRRRLFAWLAQLRLEHGFPAPNPAPNRGERRRRVSWAHVEYLEAASPLEASRASEARRRREECGRAIQAWEDYARAIGRF